MYWEIGQKVPLNHQESLRLGIKVMHQYAAVLDLPEIKNSATFYLFHDHDGLSAAYAGLKGWEQGRAREHLTRWPQFGEAGLGFIFINSAQITRDELPPVRLMSVAAHELSHVYQYGLGMFDQFHLRHDEVRVHGPAWLQEGVAEFHALRALARGGVFPYERRRGDYARRARIVEHPLEEMETYAGLLGVPGGYELATMAAEYLAAKAGEEALIIYWALLGPETNWTESFQTAFGVTVQDLYTLFEEHRAMGFPMPSLP